MPPLDDPFTREELLGALAAVRDAGRELWLGFDAPAFFAPLGEAWSPADNVRHLIKSNRPVARALAVPKLLLLLRFGISNGRSRRYPEVVATYRQALAGGVTAGRFTPRPVAPEERTAADRDRFVGELAASLDEVAAAARRWSERALDRLRLPHPALGPLTVREMLLFTAYHNTHHAAGVAARSGR